MSGPAAVIVAGAITTWMAFASADGLVADDYYKRGLGINAVLKREQAAERLGIAARIERADGTVRVSLRGAAPEFLFLQFVHATRAGLDQRLRLTRTGEGNYEASLGPLPPGHWRMILEDPRAQWRIVKDRL
jgi:hypothetical protein